jgi:hypothetical protein
MDAEACIRKIAFMDVRQRNTIKILTSLRRELPLLTSVNIEKYLDLGCSDGAFTIKVAQILNAR